MRFGSVNRFKSLTQQGEFVLLLLLLELLVMLSMRRRWHNAGGTCAFDTATIGWSTTSTTARTTAAAGTTTTIIPRGTGRGGGGRRGDGAGDDKMIGQGLGEYRIGSARHFVIVNRWDVVLETLHGLFKCLQAFGIGNARRNGWEVVCVDMSLISMSKIGVRV
jgi:hypothetical protein